MLAALNNLIPQKLVDMDVRQIVLNVVSTVVLLVVVLLVRWLVARWIRRIENLPQASRMRWMAQARNAIWIIFFFGAATIWANELQTIALSITALGVAFVLATKELIQCITGSALKTSCNAFKLGDRIEIDKVRGDVIDQNVVATTIMEIGPGEQSHQYTGRAVIIPNSKFLDKPIINESFTREFVLHSLTIPCKSADWQDAEKYLLEAAQTECSEFVEEARKHFDTILESKELDRKPVIDPRVTVAIPKAGKIDLIVRIPVPARRKGRIEQAILRRYLAWEKNDKTNDVNKKDKAASPSEDTTDKMSSDAMDGQAAPGDTEGT